MKTLDRYRFSLQWGVDSAEKIQAGDILEKLGNKKSEFVVLAVSEYLKTHPDIPVNGSDGQKINIVVQPSVTREQIEAMVIAAICEQIAGMKPVIHEQMANMKPVTRNDAPNMADLPDLSDESNIDIMLKNLEMFTS